MHAVIGSEGNLGVITEAVIKVRPVPQCVSYGSIVFPDFNEGQRFMRRVGRDGIWPASIRLVDNLQFQFGIALKP